MEVKKTAFVLVMALSINTLGASFAFASQTKGIAPTVESENISSSKESTQKEVDIKIIDKDTFEVDGVKYSISSIGNSLKDKSPTTDSLIKPNSVPSVAIKKAFKWMVEHWTTIVSKVPTPLQKYLKLDLFMKAANQFLDISGSIEDFLHSTFRAMGMPETANWAITNIIMIALPI